MFELFANNKNIPRAYTVFVFLGGEAYNLFGSGEPWLHLCGKRRALLFVRPPTKSRAKSGGGRREKVNL